MAISLPSGFKITGKDPIDSRMVMTKAEMLAVKKAQIPDKYICICKDDGKLYIYNGTYDESSEYGRFKPYEEVIDLPGAIQKAMSTTEGKSAMEAAVSSTLPGAIENAMSSAESAQKIADAMFDSEHFQVNIDNKIDLAVSLIQAIDSN